MLKITPHISLPDDEIQLHAIHSQGAGGQNVNKVATAIHLRFDIANTSLPPAIKQRLLASRDRRVNKDGILVIKAQRYRSQEKNRIEAVERLVTLILSVVTPRKKRISTRPSKQSRVARLEDKIRHGQVKQLRKRPDTI